MSPRKKRRQRRDWRNGWGRRLTLTAGWLSLILAGAGLIYFAVSRRFDVLAISAGAAVVAVASSGIMPEPKVKRRIRFAPLEDMRSARRPPSLLRQLLTLP